MTSISDVGGRMFSALNAALNMLKSVRTSEQKTQLIVDGKTENFFQIQVERKRKEELSADERSRYSALESTIGNFVNAYQSLMAEAESENQDYRNGVGHDEYFNEPMGTVVRVNGKLLLAVSRDGDLIQIQDSNIDK